MEASQWTRRESLRLDAWREPWIVLLPAVLAVLVHANTLLNGFVYDDAMVISRLESGGVRWQDLPFAPRGITYAVHLFDWSLWGRWPAGFHLTNVLLHAVACGVVTLMALRWSGSTPVGLCCGLLFAVHPVHVEAVASFANRKDVLAMIFAGSGALLWTDPRGGLVRYVATFALLGLGVLAKEVAALGVVAMLPLADLMLGTRGSRAGYGLPLLARWAPLLLGIIGVTALYVDDISLLFEPARILRGSQGALHSYTEAIATAAGSIPDVARLLVFPWSLSFDYPIRVQHGLRDPWAIGGLALLVFWSFAAWRVRTHSRLACFAMCWVLITYLPASNVLPLSHFYLAERYLYVPSFGFCLLLAIAFDVLARRVAHSRPGHARLVWALVGVVLVAGATRSVARNSDWRDGAALGLASLSDGIETRRIHRLVGEAMWARRDFVRAAHHFGRTVELQPRVHWLRYDYAAALTMQGRIDEAVRMVASHSVEPPLGPKAKGSVFRLAMTLLKRDAAAAAATQLRDLVELAPSHGDARTALGWLLAASRDDAVRDPDAAITLLEGSGRSWDLCALAVAHAESGELERAMATIAEAQSRAERSGDDHALRFAGGLLSRIGGSAIRLDGSQVFKLLAARDPGQSP